jgi:glycosyltransferase involved in cell wall biosynthesis
MEEIALSQPEARSLELERRVLDMSQLREVKEVPLITLVTPTLGAGGAEQVVYLLAKHLPAKGYRIEVICLYESGKIENKLRTHNVRCTVLNARQTPRWKLIKQLMDHFKATRPAIVHTHLFGADVFAGIAAWIVGIPVVATDHSALTEQGFFRRRLWQLIVSHARIVSAVSNDVRRRLHEEGIPESRLEVVRNGIDMAQIKPRGTRPFAQPLRLITIGRLEPVKNHLTLLQALALVHRPWHLQIVGAGSELRALKQVAERLNIASRLEWLGHREDIFSLLQQADVFCFSSRSEGFGLVMIEAAASGVPIIASDLPALKEILEDRYATFVHATNSHAFAQAIEGLLEHETLALEKAQAAMPIITERFSVDRMVTGYAALYARVLGNKV